MLLAGAWPQLRHVIVGDGPERAALEALATSLGVADRVAFLGRLAPDDAVATARRASLFVLPSIDEAFGARFRASFLLRRRSALAVITDRAQARGDFPASPPPDLVADIVFGVIWYRVLSRDQPLDASIPARLTAVLTAAAPAAPGP